MSNKRNRIGLKSSLFPSLCSEPEDSPSDLLPSYQGTIQQLNLGTSVLKLWQVILFSFLKKISASSAKNHTDKSSTSFGRLWQMSHLATFLILLQPNPPLTHPGESVGSPPSSLPGSWGPAPPLPLSASKAPLKANRAAYFPEFLFKTHSKTHRKGKSPTVLLVCIRYGCFPGAALSWSQQRSV